MTLPLSDRYNNDADLAHAVAQAETQAMQYQSDADACMSTLLPPPEEIVTTVEAQSVPWWSRLVFVLFVVGTLVGLVVLAAATRGGF